MDIVVKAMLFFVYLLVLPVRCFRLWRGRDRLHLHRPANATSYWVVRENDSDLNSYFSEASFTEGRQPQLKAGQQRPLDRGAARWFSPVLRLLARLYAPRREDSGTSHSAAPSQEHSVPDEV